jgi:hypothetical protein
MIVSRARVFLVTAVVGVLAAGARPASAQSLITNGGFDGNANGWILTFAATPSTYDPAVDFANNASSGSARLTESLLVGNGDPIAAQCINVTSHIHESFTLTANVLFTAPGAGGAGSGQGILAWQGFSDTACATVETVPAQSLFPPETDGTWQTNSITGIVPATVQSILVAVGVTASGSGGAFNVHADNIDFVTTASVPTMSTVWLTLLAVGCALAMAIRHQRRALAR